MRALLLFLILLTAAHAEPTGISRALAAARAARLSDLRYNLAFTLIPKSPTTEGHETLTFTLAPGPRQDLPIDFRDGTIQSASLNTKPISTSIENGHLTLPATSLITGQNTLTIAFTANIAPAGKALTRYLDKDDGNEYLYTLFVPMDADMAFPCFDQPDLKARFTLAVEAPTGWKVIGNTQEAAVTGAVISSIGQPGRPDVVTIDPNARHTFPETKPISTYLFAFAAGPFARIPGAHPGEPDVYVRQSQLAKAQAEVPQLQQITAQGSAYFAGYFQQPFPFPKYDLVLIPGFPFGGMEHAGATFLNEDGVLFRTTPTASDRFRRNTLTLHELCHQWFGDLVTMRWFDDLWLKEGFAQYMAYKALAQLDPASNPWKHFAEDIKPLAYAIDETQGTTPIFQQIPNLKDAKSAYGAIVYQKAPAVLKQLNFSIGEQPFRDGLRLYLQDHAYANATWPDLISSFERAGAKDLKPWADAWITHRGMPEITASFTCAGPSLKTITLRQHDVLGTDFLWPIANLIYLNFPPQSTSTSPHDLTHTLDPIRADWNSATTTLHPTHTACPTYLFANSADQAYGRFLLDPASEQAVAPSVRAGDSHSGTLIATPDPLLRSQLYAALWDQVRSAQFDPARYARIALQGIDLEQDEAISRILGSHVSTAFHAYGVRASTYGIVRGKMLQAPTLELRIVNFRTYVSIAGSLQNDVHAWSDLRNLLDGSLSIPGLELKPLDRWTIIGQLIRTGDPDAAAILAAEQARDHSGEAQKYAYAQQAATPTPQTKQKYFADYLTSNTIQEDWLSSSLRPFNSWNQTTLTEPYLKQSLDALPSVKANRKIFFLGAWLSAFIDGQHSPEAQQIVHTWLAQPNIDPDLRLKVLELSDELDRTVKIRRTYPN